MPRVKGNGAEQNGCGKTTWKLVRTVRGRGGGREWGGVLEGKIKTILQLFSLYLLPPNIELPENVSRSRFQ